MRKIKKLIMNIIIIMLIIILLFSNFSYADVPLINAKEAGEALANFALNTVSNHSEDIEYSNSTDEIKKAYANQEKVDGKYKLNGVYWITFAVNNSLGLTNSKYIDSSNNGINGFKRVVGDGKATINEQELNKNLTNGDILVSADGIYAICCGTGNNQIIYFSDSEKTLKQEKISSDNTNNESTDEKAEEKDWVAIIRITEETANSLKATNVTTLLVEDRDDEEYSKYYGTTEGRYVGSYNILSWLFNQFLGFMDYLFGIIAYILRAPFVGWANIIENMINDTINNLSGVQTTNKQESGSAGTMYTPSAMDTYVSKRINIEDIIYNKVPVLDVDFFDVNLEKYNGKQKNPFEKSGEEDIEEVEEFVDNVNNNDPFGILNNNGNTNEENTENNVEEGTDESSIVISKDSVIYKLRENIAMWYTIIRNISIVALLIVLLYLGIRLAISSTGEGKAKYKEMLVGWVTSFIIVFFIHYFMIIVININETLVNIFYDTLEKANGGVSLYDTVRTRAYSFKLSEGVPATIMYMFLIYFLIRFLVVYIKRYFTVNILALMGPVMGVKFAYDKVSSGKSRSFTSWMFDFALNVLLQSVHAILYAVFMTMAFQLSMTNIPGFVLALCMMNFVFKAEKIFMKIFKFDGRSQTLGDIVDGFDPNKPGKPKNYMLEGYKVVRGLGFISSGIGHFGFGLVKNTTKFVGGTGLLVAQAISDSEVTKARRKAKKNGEELPEYIDVQEKFKEKLDKLNKKKQRDPELYELRKKLKKQNRQFKHQVMKRNLSQGANSVKTMAMLMATTPILIANPGTGFTMLTSTIGDLKDMASDKPRYGHKTKKQIRGRRGRTAAMILTGASFVGYESAKKGFEKLEKDKKKIAKNEKFLADTRKAEILERKIEKQLSEMEKATDESAKEAFEKSKEEAIKNSLDSVMRSKDIKKIVTNYMVKNSLSKLSDSDVENILRELNLEGINSEIEKLNGKRQGEIAELTAKVEELKLAIQVNGVATNAEQKELGKMEDKISKLSKEIEVTQKIADEISKNAELNAGVLKGKGNIREAIEEYRKANSVKTESLTENDIKKIAETISDRVKKSESTYTSKEEVKAQFDIKQKKSSKGLDKKQTVNAMLDAILEHGNTGVNNDFKEVSAMIQELQALNEKSKNTHGKRAVDVGEFTRKMKGKKK